jgi:hypothetical protein
LGMQYGRVYSIKFQNKIYYIGHTDSFVKKGTPGVVEYDGTQFTAMGLNKTTTDVGVDFSFASRNDTLFVSFDSTVYMYKGSWKPYYRMTGSGIITSIATLGAALYVSELSSSPLVKIKKLGQGLVLDSFNMPYKAYEEPTLTVKLFTAGNRLLVNKNHLYYHMVQSFGHDKVVQTHFRNIVVDTAGVQFINNGNKVYCFAAGGIKINGIDYHNIAQFYLFPLQDIKTDTIKVHVFRDINKNGSYEQTDKIASNVVVRELLTNKDYSTDSFGNVELYPLDNEDFKVLFISDSNGDSCFKAPYSGAQSSGHYNSPQGKYQMDMPIWRTSLNNTNIMLKAYGSGQSRLDVSAPIHIRVFNRDCNASNSSVTVTIVIDSSTHILSSVPPYDSYSGGIVTYSMKIPPYSEQLIELKVKYPLGNYAIGDTVRHKVHISTPTSEDTSDNDDLVVTRLVYSHDPNSKHCEPEGRITSDLKRIRYHINFQNEGNDDAWRVTIVDTLNLKMPVYEFQMAGSSHSYIISHKDNVVTWVFDNINLKPKGKDEAASKGFLAFDAKVMGELRQGDSIRNKAYIYFDYNKPIVTNYAVILRKDNNEDIDRNIYQSLHLEAYPNPAGGELTIYNRGKADQHIYIYDMKGSIVSVMDLQGLAKGHIDTSAWAAGIYMVIGHSGEAIKIIIQ